MVFFVENVLTFEFLNSAKPSIYILFIFRVRVKYMINIFAKLIFLIILHYKVFLFLYFSVILLDFKREFNVFIWLLNQIINNLNAFIDNQGCIFILIWNYDSMMKVFHNFKNEYFKIILLLNWLIHNKFVNFIFYLIFNMWLLIHT